MLVRRSGASAAQVAGFLRVREALAFESLSLEATLLNRRPQPEEWSIFENLEHLRNHDRGHAEVETKGLDHYLSHGKDHVAQVARTRRLLVKGHLS